MRNGILGFFDILGYQSFLRNNPDDGAGQVVSFLVNLERTMAHQAQEAFSHYQSSGNAEKLVGRIKWLVFSDTIVVYSQFGENDSVGMRSNRWIAIHHICLLLWRRMFGFGLPIRGVIHTGDFVVEGTCLAGVAIVEAYQMAQDLDLSVCAYSNPAFSALIDQANREDERLLWRYIPAQLFEYLMPNKSQKAERLAAINPNSIVLEDSEVYRAGDLRQFVYESFMRHNKDIPESAQAKLRNTEQFLRAARMALDNTAEYAQRMYRYRKPSAVK